MKPLATPLTQLTEDLRREQYDQRRQVEDARLRAANAAQVEPDRARRVLTATQLTGLPSEVVDADLDSIEQSLIQRNFDVDEYRKQAPAWTSFAAENPYHLAVLEEDMENMGRFERAFHQIGLGWDSTWATVEYGNLQTARRRQGGELTPEQQEKGKRLQEMMVGHDFGADGFVKFLVKNAKMAGPTLYSMGEGLETAVMAGTAAATVTLAAGQMGPQIAVPEEVATVPLAFGAGFKYGMAGGAGLAAYELESGFAYGEYRDMGMTHEDAALASRAVGGVNAGLEVVGIGKALKYIPWMRNIRGGLSQTITGNVLTRPSIRRATGTAIARFGEVLGTEVVTEVMQESVTAITGEIMRPDGAEAMTLESYLDRIADTALETMQGAFIMSSIGPGMSYYADLRKANQADNMQAVYEALGETAKESSTRQALPEKFKEFVDRLRQDGPVSRLYVDAERFDTFFQENGQDPNTVAAELGVDADQLNEAREIGGDIEIEIGQYAEKIAPTDAHNGLIRDLKSDPDAMSFNEAEAWRKTSGDVADQIEKLSASAVSTVEEGKIEQIIQDVQGQLVAAGYETGAAGHLAQIMRGIGVLAERNGMDPIQLYEQVFGGVRRVTAPALEATDVDVFIDPLLDRLRNQDFPSQREMFGPTLMDFINESGGIAIEDAELQARDFELGAQDLGVSKAKLNRWRTEGRSVADIAEIAAEQGYIADSDPNLLLEAIDRELTGQPVHSQDLVGDVGLRDLSDKLDELASFIQEAGIDLETMSNPEIRAALEKRKTLNQVDTKELEELTELVTAMASAEEFAVKEGVIGDDFDNVLGKALAAMPDVFEKQDFADVEFTDTVRIQETGDTAKVKTSAQKTFDRAVKRKNVLKALWNCLSG